MKSPRPSKPTTTTTSIATGNGIEFDTLSTAAGLTSAAQKVGAGEIALNVQRFPCNQLIAPALYQALGDNINDPSVIRVPDWLPNTLGRYYMYFAHQAGTDICLVHSDQLEGPWQIHEPATLQLRDAEAFYDHTASTDVHVDDITGQILMYFRGTEKCKTNQWSAVAYSKVGINFTARIDLLGKFYFRFWRYQDDWYALAKNNNEGWANCTCHRTTLAPLNRAGISSKTCATLPY